MSGNSAQLSPLFTTTPLLRSSAPLLSISPLNTQQGRYRYLNASPLEVGSPFATRETEVGCAYSLSLTFEKVPIAPMIESTWRSHDHRSSSTTEDCNSGPESRSSTRSPSLITCLFQSNQSRHGSSSGSSQPTPTTPLSFSPLVSQICRPILRRPSGPATSASTSMTSDDTGVDGAGFGGLGLTCLDQAQVKEKEKEKEVSACESERRRTRSLKFAITQCMAPNTAIRRVLAPARSTPSNPLYKSLSVEVCEAEGSSGDEGYEEDEDGGFTSDEEFMGAVAGPSRSGVWDSKYRPTFKGSPHAGPSRNTFTTAVGTYCTTDDNEPVPCRGRKISIAAMVSDSCSRHRSPPPPAPNVSGRLSALPDGAPPPTARSPSAAGLCKRRMRRIGDTHRSDEGKIWRTQGSFFPIRHRTQSAQPSRPARSASLSKCHPIPRRSRPISGSVTPLTTDSAPAARLSPKHRSGSLPAPASIRCITPVDGQCKVDGLHAVAQAVSIGSGIGAGAKEGLKAALGLDCR